MRLRFGSVASGIEAASVAWEPLGWEPAWFAEIEPFPCAVLAHHWPNVPNLGDMTKIPLLVRLGLIELPDILVGGTPCQDFSIAGLRAGLDGARGQLTMCFIDLADELDEARAAEGKPKAIHVWENVPGVLSHEANAFGNILAGFAGDDEALEPGPRPEPGRSSRFWKWNKKTCQHRPSWPDAGCVVGPKRAVAWRVLDAQWFGLPQRRRRVFVISSAREGVDPVAILLEFEGVRRDSPPSREAGESVAGTLDARTEGGGFPGTDGACSGRVIPVIREGSDRLEAYGGNNTSGPIDVATARNASSSPHGRMDFETETFVLHHKDTTAAIDASYAKLQGCSGQDANHQHSTLVVALRGISDYGEGLPSLRAKGGDCGGGSEALAVAIRGREGGSTAELGGEVANTLRAADGGGSDPYVLAPIPILEAGARTGASTNDIRAGIGVGEPGDPMYTLQAGKQHAIFQPIPINPNALRGEGVAKTPSADADGRVRLRDPGLGVGDPGDPADTLTAAGPGAVAHTIAFSCKDYGADAASEVSPTLRAMGHHGSHANAGGQVAVVVHGTQDPIIGENVAHCLGRNAGQENAVCVTGSVTHTLKAEGFDASEDGTGRGQPIVPVAMAVRRLMPVECERLQGFEDGHTNVLARGKPAADGPRYKGIGNSKATYVVRWMGRRIEMVLETYETMTTLVG